METNNRKEKRVIYSYLAILLLIGVVIGFTGYRYHKNFAKHFSADIEKQFSLIVDLKAGELANWREGMRLNSKTVFGSEVFAKYVKSYLHNTKDSVAEKNVKELLKELQTGFNYDAVKLIDSKFVKRIIIPESKETNLAYFKTIEIDSLKAGKLVFVDFYYNELINKTFLKILVPILEQRQLISIIELRIDPQTFLYPLLTNLPILSETSEILILRREGDEAVCLNELKFQKNTALKLRVPLNLTDRPFVRAALGQIGFMEGMGFQGKAVVAYVHKVPNSPWFLVAQTDAAEVYAPLKKERWLTVIFSFVIFLISGFVLILVWRYQRALVFKERIKSAEALRESEERFRSLYENSALGIYRTTPAGKILLANDTFVKMLEFSSFEDLCSKDLEKEGYEPNYDRKNFIEQIEKDGEIIGLEAQWSKKDGTPVYIRENSKAIRDSNQKTLYYDGTVEDITELKRSELERHVIYEITQGIATTDNLNALLKLIHQSLSKVIYAENIFIALYNQDNELFEYPYWVDKFDPTPEPAAMRKSLSSYIFRSGKYILFSPESFQQLIEQNEVEQVGSYSPSWLGVPLKTPTRTIGVLVLQHYEKENVYSELDVHFLESVGSQIALAIERKRSEEELHESETKLNVILQSTADGILAIDSYGKVIKTNKRFAELWHIPQALIESGDDNSIIGFVLDQLSNPDEFISKVQKLYHSTDEDLDFLYFKDGRVFERFSAPMVMNDSSIGRVWSFRDITQRYQADDKLKKSEALYRNLVNRMPDGVYKSTHDGKFIEINPGMVKLLGYDSKEELMAIDIKKQLYFEPADRKSLVPQEKMEEMGVYRLKKKDGSDIWVEDHGWYNLGENGETLTHEGIMRDITERKHAELLIQQKNDELQKINDEKDKFFSIIAHDLRSPFNGFLGLTRIMAEGLPGFKADELQKLAVRMQNSATNLFRLLENLLHWSQMQQGIFPFNPIATRLLPVVNEIISLAEESANLKNISITNDIPGDLAVVADTAMLQTVIRNLLSNAVKFTHRGGKISISAKVENDKLVTISVMDSGIGMNAEMLNNLFSLNAQTNRKGTEKESSSGLGLLLCKEFVEKQGGKLWAESEEGKGSTFSFTIPFSGVIADKNGNANVFPSDAKENQVEKLKILIAEDDETSDFLITMAIKPLCKEILNAKTGIEAVEACRQNPDIDLVLMDIKMPVMDGYEATREIREFNKDVVIIAQTAFGETGDRERAMEAGCNGYISKPLDLTLLKKVIQKHCTQR